MSDINVTQFAVHWLLSSLCFLSILRSWSRLDFGVAEVFGVCREFIVYMRLEMNIKIQDVESMITRDCPSILMDADFLKWRIDWVIDPVEEPPYYLLASVLVRHLTHLNSQQKREEFHTVFELIEEFFLRGEPYVTEWSAIGILEDLQNRNMHAAGSQPDDFLTYLRPVSKWWWEEVDLFWQGEISPIGSSGRPHPHDMGNSALPF